ncbi:hypothetical protein EVG20_g5860 [Dentipellis fragilis]|uniref:phosphoribosylglycinamide formyltransferase 1 n=1 Tax=Dentipellis fragilis TaxID=205917 RepID=A0A4Y9YSK8_9AGAM|nr:hypothetical protein EVG20_g5860 [Dentipellis fragilis]
MSSSFSFNHQATVEDVPDEEMDLMTQLREAATTPTPLAEFLQDPDAVHSLTKMSSREYHSGGSSRRDSPARGRPGRERERERGEKDLTGDRLEHETRKADQAESRATMAEIRAREAGARALAAEQAQHHAELDAARAREETKRFQLQLDTTEREVRRLTNDMARLQRQRDESEEAAAKARDTARRFQAGEVDRVGAMVHRVVREVDRGEPLVVREVEIQKGEPLEAFEERLHRAEWEIIVEGTRKALDEVRPP